MPLSDERRDELLLEMHSTLTEMKVIYTKELSPAVRQVWKNKEAIDDARTSIRLLKTLGAMALAVMTLFVSILSIGSLGR